MPCRARVAHLVVLLEVAGPPRLPGAQRRAALLVDVGEGLAHQPLLFPVALECVVVAHHASHSVSRRRRHHEQQQQQPAVNIVSRAPRHDTRAGLLR